MRALKDKYIDLFTDFGFKKLFGSELNKALLIDFLNQLLDEKAGTIQDLTFLSTEQLGRGQMEHKAILTSIAKTRKARSLLLSFRRPSKTISKTGVSTILASLFNSKLKRATGTLN